MPNLFALLTRSYSYTKNHKFLWFFGFFLSGIGFISVSKFANTETDDTPALFNRVSHYSHTHHSHFILGVVAFLLFIAILFLLAVIARTCIIRSTVMLHRKENPNLLGIAPVLLSSRKYLNNMFFVSFISSLFLAVVFIWFLGPIVFVINHGFVFRGLALSVMALSIYIPLFFIVSIVSIFSMGFVVAFEMHISDAIKSAFDLFARYWVDALSFLMVLFALYGLILFVGATALSLLGALAYELAILLKSLSVPLYFIFATLMLLVLLLALAMINALLNAFSTVSWTLFFLDLVKASKVPKPEPEAVPEPAL